ncbi:MAG: hypothetical protein INF98_16735 [Roseomonas sp.]|jgi:hypothetical protein|nr:hypothetical protein [Roseomonas sp.]
MAFTTADLDAIKTAIARGELSVEVAGRRVVYRSTSDLILAADRIQTELANAANVSANGTRRGAFRVTFSTHRGM